MACNCKNTITSFLGGDVPNPTTFLNCGEADGTYNNPLSTGKTQCVAEDNVLRILDEYYVSGTVKNAGQIIFERTYTADTENWDEWNNSGDGYFKPILSGNWSLSAKSLTTSSYVSAGGSITTGTHDGSDILYINRFTGGYPYGHIYAGRSDQNTAVGLRFVTRNALGTPGESFSLLGDDKKATFQGNVVISGTNTTLNTLSANTAINVGNGNGTVSAATLTAGNVLKSNGTLVVTGNTVMNGTLSASSINVGNGGEDFPDGTISANTFTAPQISIGKELGVITGTTIAGKYSGSTITNSTDKTIIMTVAKFRPGMIVEVNMGVGSGDIIILLPEAPTWVYGKYTFIFNGTPNAGAGFELRTPNRMDGLIVASDGNEAITNAAKITFANGTTVIGTKIEVIASNSSGIIMTYVTAVTGRGNVTPS